VSQITKETRLESFLQINPKKRYEQILDALGRETMTARQIYRKLGYYDPNTVRPRICELVKMGILEEAEKVYDVATNRRVTAYRRAENGN